ncbi:MULTISPECIES: IucA/IucC family siderophore biosynthesis protein [unclassified Haladaptatus]|uniref:IucA/IucC family protein n=1 Tax=unclassified Haladaptatus TaxID=2622732 RepID=UPI00209BCAAF|nr:MULTISPECIES: IucA/IucC family siderophore biosynthesis protein [unclassified Haladaptatus]MCO8244795.1 IucA/IucC family siderophore biosynthesis protein [Haladaptatus sp. AB643]MCO8255693.1 IucA/IucC family siderophore biosynthesis protein [Haladaptatus sp. AB618]
MENLDTLRSALREETWEDVNAELLQKILQEFLYEDILVPTREGTVPADGSEPGDTWNRYRLELSDGVAYRFDGQSRLLDSYRVRSGTVQRCTDDGSWSPATDPVQFIIDVREHVGIDPTTTAHLIREFNNTLVADSHQRTWKRNRENESILDLPYAEIEGEMEGHPWFTYNKGRVGFGYDDYLEFTPEAKEPQHLSWIAVHGERSVFSAIEGIDHTTLLSDELNGSYGTFREKLAADGLDPDDYFFMPVHEWQWNDSIVQVFAEEIATDRIVPLGEGPDEYLAQQSIRTFSNVSNPEKHHVKLPIRVLNTNVYRGLLGEQAEAAPRVTSFIKSVRDDDPFLRDEHELLLPGEIASVNYEHPKLSQIDDAPYQYHELLGCVWRESVLSLIDEGEEPLTLAALLHEDFDGTPVITSLVERSGMELEAWLDRFLETLLEPLLHFLYKYGTVFMPHGTNVILVHEDGVPVRVAIKDFVDEVAITDRQLPELNTALPDELRDDERYKHHILHQLPPEPLCQHIFGTLFVGVFRYVSDLLERDQYLDEAEFWRRVGDTIEGYHRQHPELEDRFELFDLFKPEFAKHCLNRNRILDHGYEDYSTRPKVQGHGTVPNPLHEIGE